MTDREKAWIDSASYEELLRRWRFSLPGDPLFMGDTGTYYAQMMRKKREADLDGAVVASKRIGWDR